jgi:hypothetical protein
LVCSFDINGNFILDTLLGTLKKQERPSQKYYSFFYCKDAKAQTCLPALLGSENQYIFFALSDLAVIF